jgi:hypothetical protein
MLYTIPLTHNEDLNAFDIVLQENFAGEIHANAIHGAVTVTQI